MRESIFNEECEIALKHACHFAHWHEIEFLKEHDYAHIRGESNVIRYLPVESVLLRVEERDTLDEILASIIAIKMVGASLHISIPKHSKKAELIWLEAKQSLFIGEKDSFSRDEEDTLVAAMDRVARVRFLHPENVTPSIYESIASKTIYIASEPFLSHGRIELMHYFIEQSVTNSYHRYGNLGMRGLKVNRV
jgi:RHH-type proline utilization regulon transcriptional repressor/proline dehydrogenase/delta 1-pyrroline-5-carboxylate dehydrogenase